MINRFVVLSTQRTGSTMLITLLDSHPDVFCAGEILSPGSGSAYAIRRRVSESPRNKILHAVRRSSFVTDFLDEHYSRDDSKAIGFKFMYSDARLFPRSYPSVVNYLTEKRIHVIHNVRQNKLRVVLSRVSSKSSGLYRSEQPVARDPIHLPIKGLLTELRKLEKEDQSWAMKVAGQPYLRVVYESLLENPATERSGMLEFIGVDQTAALSTPYVKLTTGALAEFIKNFDDVERELKDTEFEWCLYREVP